MHRLTIEPDPTRRQELGETCAVTRRRIGHDFIDRRTGYRITPGSGDFARLCEQPEGGHTASVPAVRWAPVTTSTTRVLVLRHGQSEWNALGRWQGQADPPLTTLGRLQARQAGHLLSTECPTFDLVISSDLERAAVTGDLLAEEIGCVHRRSDARWRENDAGEWQGLTRQQINEGWPGWLDADKRPPNFETVESTTGRTLQAFGDIVKFHPGGCILVVSHGGVIRLLRRHFTGKDHRFPNLGGSWFEHDGSQWLAGSLLFPLELIAEELRNTGAVE